MYNYPEYTDEKKNEYREITIRKCSFGLRTILSLCLLISFFLPWFSGISGFEIPLMSGCLMSGSAISLAGFLGGSVVSMYIVYVLYILPLVAIFNIFLDVFKVKGTIKSVKIAESIRNGISLLLIFLPFVTLFSGATFWEFFVLFMASAFIIGWYQLTMKKRFSGEFDLYIASEFLIGIFIAIYICMFAAYTDILTGFGVGYYATLLFSVLGLWTEVKKHKKDKEEK